jgi:hypothetical protein
VASFLPALAPTGKYGARLTLAVQLSVALCIGAAFLQIAPLSATSSGGNLERINAPLVTYRTSAVAYVRDAKGRYTEQPLVSAALGAGDRIRYLIVATNATKTPQLAGVAVRIPNFTMWDPSSEFESPDIIQWTTDRVHWHSGAPPVGQAQQVRLVRWVLSDKLRSGLSAAFVFQLRLTGPFSDRTGDLNMSRPEAAKAITTLNNAQIREIQREVKVDPDIADPLGLSALYAEKSKLLHFNGQLQAQIAMRNDVAYTVAGSAFVRDDQGIVSEVPLSQAKLHAGDRVRFVFTARNQADGPRQVGATFTIPAYAHFLSATKGNGVLDVSSDGVEWRPIAKRGKTDVQSIRWTHAGPLAPGATAQFMVELSVARAPLPDEFTARNGQGSFDPLSSSAVQSVLFTNGLTINKDQVYAGVPVTQEVIRGVNALAVPAIHGFVASGATPIADHEPVDTAFPNQQQQADSSKPSAVTPAIGLFALAVIGVVFLLARRGSGGGRAQSWDPDAAFRRPGSGSYDRSTERFTRGSDRGETAPSDRGP